MTDTVLEIEGVTKKYGDFTAVRELDLQIDSGQVYGFLGPNGSGKTTTLRMILEIIKPTTGRITVFGRPSALEVRDRIGYLPEEKGLYKKMKAWAIVAYFASLKGLDRKAAKQRAYELLERYGLKDFAEQRTEALSKGMGQKVQVLAAIAHDPDLVILDEPFSGLDPVNQQVLEEVIKDMKDRQKTILFSTHVMQHAERMCDRILLIAKGIKRFDGTVPEAKQLMPRRARIETTDPVDPIRAPPEVLDVLSIDAHGQPRRDDDPDPAEHWEIRFQDAADPQLLLRTCFDNNIRLKQLDHSEPSLHDVFVHLVGDDAREAAHR